MKKFLFVLTTAIFLFPSLLPAREVVRLTRYSGQTITGVSASDLFQVQLIKSPETKAVVEIDGELETYLKMELRSGGIVSVGLNIPNAERRQLERGNGWRNKTIKLTLYLPELNYVKLEDMAKLTTEDRFEGGAVELKLEDMGKILKLALEAERVSVKAEDMAHATLAVQAGSITAKADDMAKITLTGGATEAYAESNDMAKIHGEEFTAERATLKAADMAKTSMYVTRYLYARSSDMASVDYKGNPAEIDLKTPRRTINTRAQ